MDTNNIREITGLLTMPFDIIVGISEHLDLCSNTSLMDTCKQMRYLYLSSKYLWRRIVFDLDHSNLSKIYSSLRKLDDSNGLRENVTDVIMDDNDDAFFSPIIMFVKFPNLQRLRARNRRDNTNLEIDIKLLQEMMKFDRLKPGTLLIEKLSIYHYYMDYEPHLPLFQKTLNKLSIHPHVELDIRACGYLPDDQKENELEHELSLLEQRINRLQMELDGGRPRNRSDEDASFRKVDRCQRIVCVDAQCWSCGYRFDRCWKCVPVCGGCHIKRMPPMANDNQIRLKKRIQNKVSSQIKADEDAFSVFG